MRVFSPAIWRLRNVKWWLVAMLLLALNLAVLWLWSSVLALRYQRNLMYLGYLPLDSRSNVLLPHVPVPASLPLDNVEDMTEGEGLMRDGKTESLAESVFLTSADGTRLHGHFYRYPSTSRFQNRRKIRRKDKNERHERGSRNGQGTKQSRNGQDTKQSRNGRHSRENEHSTATTDTSLLPPTILYFHGTSGNIGHRVEYARTLSALCQCNLLLLSCRGYGLSSGEAHRRGMQQDSQTALEYLHTRRPHDVDPTRIFVLGQSMGGAISIDLAMRNPGLVRGLIVDNTFTRIRDLLPEVAPPLASVGNYITEDWDSLGAIERCVPVNSFPHALFLIGAQDELIDCAHGKRLYAAAAQRAPPEKRIRMFVFPHGRHIHTFREPFYFDIIAQFVNEVSG